MYVEPKGLGRAVCHVRLAVLHQTEALLELRRQVVSDDVRGVGRSDGVCDVGAQEVSQVEDTQVLISTVDREDDI